MLVSFFANNFLTQYLYICCHQRLNWRELHLSHRVRIDLTSLVFTAKPSTPDITNMEGYEVQSVNESSSIKKWILKKQHTFLSSNIRVIFIVIFSLNLWINNMPKVYVKVRQPENICKYPYRNIILSISVFSSYLKLPPSPSHLVCLPTHFYILPPLYIGLTTTHIFFPLFFCRLDK